MSVNYLIHQAGMLGDSDRVSSNEGDVMRKEKEEKKPKKDEKKEKEAKKEFEEFVDVP